MPANHNTVRRQQEKRDEGYRTVTIVLCGILIVMVAMLVVTVFIWPNRLPDKEAPPDAVVDFIKGFVHAAGAQEREQLVEEYILSPKMIENNAEDLSEDYYILSDILRCDEDNILDVEVIDSGEHYVKFAMLDRDAMQAATPVYFFYTLNTDGKTILRYTISHSISMNQKKGAGGSSA